MKQQVIIDRFEGDFAVCEQADRTMVNIARAQIPAAAQEGDVLVIDGDAIRMDVSLTAARAKRIEELTEDLWQ